MRKRLIILAILTGLLLITGVLFYLYKTGKLGIGADTTTQTYTISGRSFDPLANAPMPGQNITITADSGQTAQTQTDADGRYTARIQTSVEGLINVQQGDGGMEGDTCDLIPPTGSDTLTCNFNLGQPPFDEDALFEFFNQNIEPASTKSDTLIKTAKAASGPDLSQFEWVEIDGVTYKPFVTIKDPNYKPDLTELKDQVVFNAQWLLTLKNATGVIDDFPIVLVSKIDWVKTSHGLSIGGFMQRLPNKIYEGILRRRTIMVLGKNNLYPSVISHEFGHNVDRANQTLTPWPVFPGVYADSSDTQAFRYAFKKVVKSGAITGYATTNIYEMFAEFFASIMEPRGSDPTQINFDKTGQQNLTFNIATYLLNKVLPNAVYFFGLRNYKRL